jgi:hypothetical protein
MNGLLNQREVVYIVGFAELGGDTFFGKTWLPMALVLDERDTVMTLVITDANEDRFATTGD